MEYFFSFEYFMIAIILIVVGVIGFIWTHDRIVDNTNKKSFRNKFLRFVCSIFVYIIVAGVCSLVLLLIVAMIYAAIYLR